MDWQKITTIPKEISDITEPIYISPLDNEDMKGFYKQFAHQLPLVELKKENIDVLREGKGLLIFKEDFFPACPKISLDDIWKIFLANEMERIADLTVIDSAWASVTTDEAKFTSRFIQEFDKGYDIVSIVKPNGDFIGLISSSDFRNGLIKSSIDICAEPILNYDDNLAVLKRRFAKLSYETGFTEIPILKNRKIVALGRRCQAVDSVRQRKFTDFPELHWELISDETAQKVFQGRKRILISSTMGDLSGLLSRFQNTFNISVYNDSLWERYMSGYYDLLIYGYPVWLPNATTSQYIARQIYADMLAEEVRSYLEHNGVSYYFVHMGLCEKIKNFAKRVYRLRSMLSEVKMIFSDIYEDYAIPADVCSDKVNVVGGRRKTIGTPEAYANTVYVFGPCTAYGAFAGDDETIESFLQKRINEARLPYRVVNCGGNGGWIPTNSDLNYLYALMDIHYSPGDIIIHFGHTLWLNHIRLAPRKFIEYGKIFNTPPNDTAKCFSADFCVYHIDHEGNKIIADAIFDRLDSEFRKKCGTIRPFFEFLPRTVPNDNELAQYLSRLKSERVKADTVGAIVMNCNPFTLGHGHLVDFARRQVDFLYVFVVEEDLSEFRFRDRLAMAERNCKNYDNVKVLPSGKYMISSFTFSEYFNKDSLQGQVITPAKDIRIFGRLIAPCLGISKRFVGQEPLDSVTQQYNEAMKDMLHEYGVQLVEIPRLCLPTGEVISATKVRELLKKGQFDKCKNYLSNESLVYIACMKRNVGKNKAKI